MKIRSRRNLKRILTIFSGIKPCPKRPKTLNDNIDVNVDPDTEYNQTYGYRIKLLNE